MFGIYGFDRKTGQVNRYIPKHKYTSHGNTAAKNEMHNIDSANV